MNCIFKGPSDHSSSHLNVLVPRTGGFKCDRIKSNRHSFSSNLDYAALKCATASPMALEILKIVPRRTPGSSSLCPSPANAMEAMHPHCEQSGSPPNWQGWILVFKSAETVSVEPAKMH